MGLSFDSTTSKWTWADGSNIGNGGVSNANPYAHWCVWRPTQPLQLCHPCPEPPCCCALQGLRLPGPHHKEPHLDLRRWLQLQAVRPGAAAATRSLGSMRGCSIISATQRLYYNRLQYIGSSSYLDQQTAANYNGTSSVRAKFGFYPRVSPCNSSRPLLASGRLLQRTTAPVSTRT